MAKEKTLSSGYILRELLRRNEAYLREYEGLKPLMAEMEAAYEDGSPGRAGHPLRKLVVAINFSNSEEIQIFCKRWGLKYPMNPDDPNDGGCIVGHSFRDRPTIFEARENGDGALISKGDLVIAIPPQYRPAELKKYFEEVLKFYRKREMNIPASPQRVHLEPFIEQLRIYDEKKTGRTFGEVAKKVYGPNGDANRAREAYLKIKKQVESVKPLFKKTVKPK